MKLPLCLSLAAACLLMLLSSCAQKPLPLSDYEVIPTGSKVEFWVRHDSEGWRKSNIHIAMLPRPMTGLEARHWAEGTGSRDAGLLWTQYYLLVTPEGHGRRPYRSPVYQRRGI